MAAEFKPDTDDVPDEPDVYDKYSRAKLVLDKASNDRGNIATVKRRLTDHSG